MQRACKRLSFSGPQGPAHLPVELGPNNEAVEYMLYFEKNHIRTKESIAGLTGLLARKHPVPSLGTSREV